MERGAGSVAVSARPIFPKTLLTSGKLLFLKISAPYALGSWIQAGNVIIVDSMQSFL